MGNLASLTFLLGANTKDFQTKMRKASNTLRTTGQSMKKMGGQMSMYVTGPILALGGASLAAFDKQAQAEAKLAAQVRNNGKDVQATMASYKSFASSLQNVTTVGDETTLGLMQMAETMQAANVEEATKGAIGLSKALGVDLQAAMKMVVLAQNGEYTMLNRYVPALRNASTETEKASIVNKLYADGLAIAQQEAQTGLGPLKQLKNTIGDITEEFGALIAEAIKPAVEWLKSAAEKFQGLSTKGKRTIAIIGGIAAAMGPLLLAAGALVTILPAIASGLALITGPVGLVVAAIAALAAAFVYVYDNWEAFKERLSNWDWLKNAAIDAFIALIQASSYMLNELAKLFGIDFVAPLVEQLEKLKGEPPELTTEFKSFGDTVKSVASEVMDAMGFLGTSGAASLDKITTSANRALSSISQLNTRQTTQIAPDNDVADLKPPTEPPVVSREGIQNVKDYTAALNEFDATASAVGNSVGVTLEDMGNSMVESLGLAKTGFEGFVSGILGTIVKLISMMLAQAMAQSIAGATSSGVATGPGAVVATPIFIATAIAGVLSAFAAIPKFADGGIVPGGFPNDTYPALLSSGEAVIPAPIPLSNAMGNNGNIKVSGSSRISGKDLLIVFDKAMNDRDRVRGY